MAVVDHRQRVVFFGEADDGGQIGDRAVHREYPVSDDEAGVGVVGLAEFRGQVVHVIVLIAVAPRLAQPDAVDDAGMVQRVADYGVIRAQDRLEQPAVRVEAGGVQDRVFRAEVGADALLQLLVQGLRAADEAHRGDTEPVLVERLVRGFPNFRVVGQSEVVVRAEIENLLRRVIDCDVDLCLLWTADDAFGLVKSLGVQRLGSLRE